VSDFKIGQFVTVSIGSGFSRSSKFGTIDSFTSTGQVRVRLDDDGKIATFRAYSVHAMSETQIARYHWLAKQPKPRALMVRTLGAYYHDDRPGFVETTHRVPLEKLEVMRAEIDALIAWRDAEPKETP